MFHSLWQGFLLVVLVSLAIVVTKRSSATVRYRIFSSLFFIFIGTTLCTFIIEFSSLRSIPTPSLLTGNELGDTLTLSTNTHTAAVDLKVPLPGRLAFYFNEYGPWLMLLWFIVFMLKSIRLGINYAQVQRIRNEKPYLLPAIEKRVNELAKLLRIRRKVILRETTSITVPITIGFLKPLILIPVGLINNLPSEQVEAILLHELAHIKRMDYLVNLLQCLAETIFFFNPAVLWLSSLLREERENCCDDIAITITQNKSLFIHALVAFQEYHASHPMAPGLQGNKYPLLKRIQRIVYNNNKKLNHMEKIFLAAGLVVTGIVAMAFTTPATHKKDKTDTNTGITQTFQPGFSSNKDSVPEQRIEKGSMNTTIDGKKYKVVIKDDKPVELYIDEKRVPDNELENHHVIMEKIMEDGRAKFFKDRKSDKEAKEWLDLYAGQGPKSERHHEEALLLEKLFKEQNRNNQLVDMESKADLDKKMKLFQDDARGNELFNQQKKMELQDRFLKELKDDKTLTDLQKDNFLKDLQNDINASILLLDKLKNGGEDEKLAKEYLLLLDKQNKDNDKNEAEFQLNLQKDQKLFEKNLQLYQDTSKPRKVDEKRMKEMKESDAEREEKLKEMGEYRAMLQKEREKDRQKMDKEREKDRKEFEEKKKEMQKEREKERREMEKEKGEKMKEMQKEREKDRKKMEEKRNEMQKEREKERKEWEKEKGGKMKEMQKEREKDRKKMEEKRNEMQKEREKNKRDMEEERRREEREEKNDNDDKRKADVRINKSKPEFNYNTNKSSSINNSKEETVYVNKNGEESFDYKWNAKGYKPDQNDKLKFDKDGNDNGKLFQNGPNPKLFNPRQGNERVAAKRAESADRKRENNEHRNQMLNELKEDGIVPKDATEFSIHINDNEMIVNGVKQPDKVFSKYRDIIKKTKRPPNEPKPVSAPVIKVAPIKPAKVV